MAVNLSMLGNGFQFLDNDGIPLNGGKIYTYQAGSTTPLATYTDSAGLVANANPIILGTSGRPPSEIWLTEGYYYKFILKDSNDVTISTYDNLYGAIATAPVAPTSFTTGMIMLWSGSIGSIPSGWVLCNGSNGTPDLRNRFVVAAGSTYAVDATGGSADAIVVSHTHTATSSVTDSGHTHSVGAGAYIANTINERYSDNPGNYNSTGSQTTGSSTTGVTVSTTVASAGTSGTGANLPPYYALAYIMKT